MPSALLWSRVIRRPSVVNLSHFRLFLWNHWTEFNETWRKARSQRLLPSLCFSGRSEKQDGRPGLWLADTFSTSSLKPPRRNATKLDWKQDINVLYQVCVFRALSVKQDGCPGLWLAETFWTSSLKLLNWIQWNLTGSKISTSSTKFVFFGPIGKTRWPPWLLIGWVISTSPLKPLNRIQRNLTGSKISMGRSEKQDGRPGLWLAETFWLLLWNGWTEMKEHWQEARYQCPLPSLCFLGQSEKQDCRPGLWLTETFSTSLKPLNRIQRNFTGSKISMSSTKFVFFGPIGKTRWPPWPLNGWDIFYFSETAELNSTKLDRKQDINVLYQVCVFRADRKNKMAALASDWLRLLDFSSETPERNSTKLDRKQDIKVLYKVCVFRADGKNKMAVLASDWLRRFRLLWNRWTEFNETWQEARSQRLLPSFCLQADE